MGILVVRATLATISPGQTVGASTG
jgi:hypothetical protein